MNVGCPSSRYSRLILGWFDGSAEVVARGCEVMAAVDIPVTVKHRIGLTISITEYGEFCGCGIAGGRRVTYTRKARARDYHQKKIEMFRHCGIQRCIVLKKSFPLGY